MEALASAIVVLVLVAATPADARTTLVAPDGSPSPLATVLAHAKASSPTVTLVATIGACFDGGDASCTTPSLPGIWINPHQDPLDVRIDVLHEIGHRFDYLMSDHARQRFLKLTARTGRPWRDARNSPHEQFAEAWRLCATNPRRVNRSVLGYGYNPSRRTHRKVCRTIRREADRQDWSP